MASLTKRLPTNVCGNFFVDSTCINCDTCRQLAPASFVENGEFSSVYHQPGGARELHQAYQALLACPVGSIGTVVPDKAQRQTAASSFPVQLEAEIFYNGFNSGKSFGANSYFICHPEGNWLVDSPRYQRRLVDAFDQKGGVKYLFLTHEDDVADAGRYAKYFGATRIIHRADLAAMPDAEWVVEGRGVLKAAPGFRIIPVPGHTAGSMALLYKDRYLFTGDHMAWDRGAGGLRLATRYVWSEEALQRSTASLLTYAFEWILPGHGDRIHLPAPRMKDELRRVLERRPARSSERRAAQGQVG